ncbi:MAG: type II toxin-antitoxin system RelB/DinJ family antitoxin [Candidatus Omnitrophica bacterium]|nr:type II toxin-antitoxin system RelB/DinJ family antitoxin [Candidatus Omnitrophota bacterium]
MAKTAMIRARTEAGLKAEVNKIFHQLGLSCSEAINLFFKQVTLKKGIPFDISLPNKTTLKAMKDVENEKGIRAANNKDLFKKLGI